MSYINEIRNIIFEQMEELFAVEDDAEIVRLSRDSLDDQVDAFLMRFENASISQEEEDFLKESMSNMTLSTFLSEQDEPQAEEPTDEDAVESNDEEGEPPVPNIDIDEFTKKVVRLSENSEALLEIKSVIINRALNYILENYDEVHFDEMVESLDLNFGIDKDNIDDEASAPEAPLAVGAWAGGTGGLAGGGGA